MKILVPLAEGFEEMEAIVPIDVWRRAGFEVVTAGLKSGNIKASRQTTHVPDALLDDVLESDYDLIFLPGGQPGTNNLAAHGKFGEKLKKQAAQNKMIAAICAAPMVLYRLGLLKGKKFTCHPSVREELKEFSDARVVVDGKIITAPGPGAAMGLAFEVVKIFAGEQKVSEIRKAMMC